MPRRRNVACACGHEQQRHELGFGRCACGCDAFHLKVRTVEVLEMLEVPIYAPAFVPPLWRVRCPECTGEYNTRTWRRDLVTRRRCRKCADARKVDRAMRPELRASSLGDMSPTEKFPHGTRARYAKGCRCDDCRAANNAYERMRGKMIRAGTWVGLVDAKRVRAHLLKLAAAGVGLRAVADVARANRSQLQAIKNGRKKRLLRSTADRILAVNVLAAAGDATLVDGAWTRRLIALLLEQGFTRYALAARLGSESKTPALQLGQRQLVTAKTQQRVERLYLEIMGRLPRSRNSARARRRVAGSPAADGRTSTDGSARSAAGGARKHADAAS